MSKKKYNWIAKDTYIPNEEVRKYFEQAVRLIDYWDYGDLDEILIWCYDLPLRFFPKNYQNIIKLYTKCNSKIKIQIKEILEQFETKSIDITKVNLHKLIQKVKYEEKTLPLLPKWRQTIDHSTDFSRRIFEQIINPTKELFEIILLARAKFVNKFTKIPYIEYNRYTIRELILPVINRIPAEFRTFDWCSKLVSKCPLFAIIFTEYEYTEYTYDTLLYKLYHTSENQENVISALEPNISDEHVLLTYNNFKMAYIKYLKWLVSEGIPINYKLLDFKNMLYNYVPELLLGSAGFGLDVNFDNIMLQCIKMKRPFADTRTMQYNVFNSNDRLNNSSIQTDVSLYYFSRKKYLTILAYEEIIIRMFSKKNIPKDCSISILEFIIPTRNEDLAYEIYEKNGNEHARNIVNNYVNTVHDVLFNLTNPVIPADCINLIITYINKADMFRRHRVTTCEEY